jgi:catechol 2,3-dioxygenase-like lactoylglutathione lyase family enzyme
VPVASFDHVAMPTNKPEEMIAFYGALGFAVPDVAKWRAEKIPFFSIHFGNQKINVHAPGLWHPGRLHAARSDREAGLWRSLLRVGGWCGAAALDARGREKPRSSRGRSSFRVRAAKASPSTRATRTTTCSSSSIYE